MTLAESDWITSGSLWPSPTGINNLGRIRIGDAVRHAVVKIPDNRQGPFAWCRGVGCDAAFTDAEENMQNAHGNQ